MTGGLRGASVAGLLLTVLVAGLAGGMPNTSFTGDLNSAGLVTIVLPPIILGRLLEADLVNPVGAEILEPICVPNMFEFLAAGPPLTVRRVADAGSTVVTAGPATEWFLLYDGMLFFDGDGGSLYLAAVPELNCDGGREYPKAEAARDGGTLGLSAAKNPDCLRLAGEGEGGIAERVSTVRSDRDGRDLCCTGSFSGDNILLVCFVGEAIVLSIDSSFVCDIRELPIVKPGLNNTLARLARADEKGAEDFCGDVLKLGDRMTLLRFATAEVPFDPPARVPGSASVDALFGRI